MFRPMFQTLEERAVFSVAPLDLPPDVQSLTLNFTKVEGVVGTDHAWETAASMQWGTGRGLAGDFNGDGRNDLAEIASQGLFFHILPYIEQDNLYKQVSSLSKTALDDEALVSQLTGRLRGEAIDIIPLVLQPGETASVDAAHDVVFTRQGGETVSGDAARDALFSPQGPGSEGYLAWDDPRQQQIIAILIGLVASRSEDSTLASKDADGMADITDGTSNTLMLASRRAAGALDLNDLFI